MSMDKRTEDRLDMVVEELRAIRTVLVGLDGNNGLVSNVRDIERTIAKHKSHFAWLAGVAATCGALAGLVMRFI